MNPTSVAVTTTAAFSATQGGQVIEWLGTLAHVTIPESVAMTLATLCIPVIHALYNRISARVVAPNATTGVQTNA